MMKILVAGLINCETNVAINEFPLEYEVNRFLFNETVTNVSGVGYNQAKALCVLGADVMFASLIGQDLIADMIKLQLKRDGMSTEYLLDTMEKTPQSVILYEKSGRRMSNTDLQAIQDHQYPKKLDLTDVTCAFVNNILFAKPLLLQCKEAGVPIISDLHSIETIDDVYNRPWLEAADILFLSDEKLPRDIEGFVRELVQRFPKQFVIVGCGKKGALMYEANTDSFFHQPIIEVGEVKNTIGAGDALCSSFTYFYFSGKSAKEALFYATYFAAYKIQYSGGAVGFIEASEVEKAVLPLMKAE